MFSIDKNNKIRIIQGDTASLDFTVADYVLKEGDTVYFTVKEDYDKEAIIEKAITEFENGVATIKLTTVDTNIAANTYLYDVQVSLADGTVDTVITPSRFQVLGGITSA